MKKIIVSAFAGLLFIIAIFSFRPISLSKENSLMTRGVVKSARLSPTGDLEFYLVGDQRMFYINRATDKNLDVQKLVRHLPHGHVTLYYADQWTILDPLGSSRHVTQLTFEKDLLFTELQ